MCCHNVGSKYYMTSFPKWAQSGGILSDYLLFDSCILPALYTAAKSLECKNKE